ncbi:hypothetical protein [Nocardioides dongkuii]|uniref:hypothetical protein n=1 Tax=Nocardioides dongkuii TaxID=2760089 RepID=UPI00187842DE|nr:hypothetical protein [Nocardioides dongkuii]
MSTAPTPPGPLGSAPAPAVLQAYLQDLDAWVRDRRAELAELDAAAIAAQRGADVASDMALALSLWKAVADRWQLMWATWDGGRVGEPERQRITALVWGRLDSTVGTSGGGTSLPEACRLSDALVGQLKAALALAPGAEATAGRVRDLRAQLERLRDQVGLEPAVARDRAVDRLAGLMARLDDVTERARRGADVGGLLGPLEQDAATFERDLIVGNARRREARGLLEDARERVADLEHRETALRTLADRCVRAVDPAPRLAVPDVSALGPVPNTPERIQAYVARLGRVEQALALAEERYAAALAELSGLVDLLDVLAAKAAAHGLADQPDLLASEQRAREVLAREPAPVPVGRSLVGTYQTWLDQLLSKESA